jgi:signal transduction histidine kinase
MKHAFTISFADNGQGMTRAQETDLKSLGIMGMKERIARLGGEFNIFSEPDKGTRLDIVIPAEND